MSSTYVIDCQDVVKKFKVSNSDKKIFTKFADFVSRIRYSEKLTVLDGVSFKVTQGEMLGIIGKNGTGKTTLLRLVANTIRPDKGTIKTFGNVIPLLELGTGFDGNMTARENIIFYGTILGFKKNEIKNRTDEIIRFAGLEDFANVRIKKFSTGMIARLGFSTLAQIEPDIMLVDEILSVGDLSFQQKSYKAFNSFKDRKKTILFVSHNLENMRKLCDRLMLLHNGKIASIGEPEKVIDDYLDVLAQSPINPSTRKSDDNQKICETKSGVNTPKPSMNLREVSEMVNKKEYANAIRCLKDMLKTEPQNSYMNYLFAYCLHNSNVDYSKALHHYNLAFELGFQKFWVLYGRGSLQYILHDHDAAREDLEMAVSLNPKHEGARTILSKLINGQEQETL
jgi:lipopolysaccharide transport system ATP-binding protein